MSFIRLYVHFKMRMEEQSHIIIQAMRVPVYKVLSNKCQPETLLVDFMQLHCCVFRPNNRSAYTSISSLLVQ